MTLGIVQPSASGSPPALQPPEKAPRSVPETRPASGNPTSLAVDVDVVNGAFNVSLGGEMWLRGLPPAAGWPGGDPLSLKRVGPASSGSHPTLGPFSERRLFWTSADGIDIETAFKIFADGEAALLEQLFPTGLPTSPGGGVVLGFPSFARNQGG